jgi:hypothetical protein
MADLSDQSMVGFGVGDAGFNLSFSSAGFPCRVGEHLSGSPQPAAPSGFSARPTSDVDRTRLRG